MRECCTDHEGKPKRKYKTRADAEMVAKLRREDGVIVNIYRCEEGDGWHLTSRNTQPIPDVTRDMVNAPYLRQNQKDRSHIRDLVDDELVDNMKQIALVNLEKKIEDAQGKIEDVQEKIEEQMALYKKYKIKMHEIRSNLQEKDRELKEYQQQLNSYRQEYARAKQHMRSK